MSERVSTDTEVGRKPTTGRRSREDALAWTREMVAKGIRVVRLRRGKMRHPDRPARTTNQR